MRRPQTEAAYAKHASRNPHPAHTNALLALVLVLLDSLLRNIEEPQPEWVHCSRSTRTAESWHALRSTSRNVTMSVDRPGMEITLRSNVQESVPSTYACWSH